LQMYAKINRQKVPMQKKKNGEVGLKHTNKKKMQLIVRTNKTRNGLRSAPLQEKEEKKNNEPIRVVKRQKKSEHTCYSGKRRVGAQSVGRNERWTKGFVTKAAEEKKCSSGAEDHWSR